MKKLLSRLAAIAFCMTVFSAHGTHHSYAEGQIKSRAFSGCLDIDNGKPAGSGGNGRDVIAWHNCHGGPNQNWKDAGNGVLRAAASSGAPMCLDIDFSAPVGNGYNVIAWPNCHGGPNQRWSMNGGKLSVNAQGRNYCLDVSMASGSTSRKDVIAWPCHGGANQTWQTAGGQSTPRDYQAGPIWSNDHAGQVCPSLCSQNNRTWTGNWKTTQQNVMSVCNCK